MKGSRVLLIAFIFWSAQTTAQTPSSAPSDASSAESRVIFQLPGIKPWKAVSKDTLGAYSLVEGVRDPGQGVQAHTHSIEDEGFYVLEGQLTLYLEERRIVAPAGSFVFAPKGLRHSFKNEGTTKVRFLVIISPAGFEKFLEERDVLQKEMSQTDPAYPEKLKALQDRYGMEYHPDR